jgi:hypothetical protein
MQSCLIISLPPKRPAVTPAGMAAGLLRESDGPALTPEETTPGRSSEGARTNSRGGHFRTHGEASSIPRGCQDMVVKGKNVLLLGMNFRTVRSSFWSLCGYLGGHRL